MSEMLYTYGELDSRVRPLVCTIRKWAQVQQITRDNPGHWITNFSLTLLVIFYLQIKNILPPLNKIISYTGRYKDGNDALYFVYIKFYVVFR